MRSFFQKIWNYTIIKYFLSYLLVLSALILGFLFIMRYQFIDRYFEQLSKQAIMQIDGYSAQLDTDFLYFASVDESLRNNLSLIMSKYTNQSYYDYLTYTELKQYDAAAPLIKSIVYRKNDNNHVISTSFLITHEDGKYLLSNFPNDIQHTLIFDPELHYNRSINQLILVADDMRQELVYFPHQKKQEKHTIFFMIDVDSIKQSIKNLVSDAMPAIALVTPEGQIATGINTDLIASCFMPDRIQHGLHTLDSATTLYVSKTLTHGYSLVAMISSTSLLRQINAIFATSYSTLALLAIGGFLLVLFAMQITYLPLHRLTKLIIPQANTRAGYLQQLEQVFAESENKNQLLQDKLDKYRISLQKSMLSSIAADFSEPSHALRSYDQFFDPDAHNEFFILYMKEKDRMLHADKHRQYFSGILPGEDACIVLEDKGNSAVFLINYTGLEQNKGEVLLSLLGDYCEEEGCLCALSNSSSSLLDIPTLYENAKIASTRWPVSSVVTYNPAMDVPSLSYPHDELSLLAHALEAYNFIEAESIINKLFFIIERSPSHRNTLPDFYIKCVLVDMLAIIIRALDQENIKNEDYRDLYYETLYFNRSFSYSEKKEAIRDNTLKLLGICRQAKKSITPEQIRELIEKSFCDPNFSVSVLADHYQVSIAYMSYLLKKNLGVNFSKYIWELRLNKAKELLRDTEMPVDEVCVQIGYLNTSSFRRKFKQETDMTPSQYRTVSRS